VYYRHGDVHSNDLILELRRWWSGPISTEVAERLGAACETARAELPALALDERALVAAIARGAGDDLAAHLETCNVGELALAVAAGDHVEGAIEELERRYHAAISGACRRFEQPGYPADDLRQVLRTKLFVARPDHRPKIADYDGRGSLESWLRVTATREFIDLTRRKDRQRERAAGDQEVEQLLAPVDIQFEAIKAEYRAVVIAAMIEAVRELAAGDRHLLRQHLIAGLTIDQLGTVLGMHRATAARRIARARELLAKRTRALVGERLGLDEHELGEIYALVRSKLDVSIRTLLATPRLR
jgi:RNA polymerase sigma-70 factor, ECF subfamily